jgi:hypothetical protein
LAQLSVPAVLFHKERHVASPTGRPCWAKPASFSELESNEARIENARSALGGVDIALIAHGDLGDQLASERSFVEANRILTANFLSVVSLLIPLANRMEADRRGRIGDKAMVGHQLSSGSSAVG